MYMYAYILMYIFSLFIFFILFKCSFKIINYTKSIVCP